MKSIQSKFSGIIIISLTILALTIGMSLFVVLSRQASENSETIITLKCQEKTDTLNGRLELVSRSVDIIAAYAESYVKEVKNLKSETYLKNYVNDVWNISKQVTEIMGACTEFYFRLAPEVVDSGMQGFYYQLDEDGKTLIKHPNTNLLLYQGEAEKDAAWYHNPKVAGKPVWIEPYFDPRVGYEMISYSCPIYINGTFIGVVGMDIRFKDIVEYAEEKMNLYNNGFACLVGKENRTVYYVRGSSKVNKDEAPEKFYNDVAALTPNHLESFNDPDLGKVKVTSAALNNDLILVVIVQTRDINAERNRLIFEGLCITLCVLAITILFTIYTSKRITKPLKELTEAAHSYAEGKWDVEVKCDTKDEVKELTDSITRMARATQSYIARVNMMAYKDGLTGLKNKSCFLEFADRIKNNENGEWNEYAIIIFDVNYLKETNDNFGHEIGDKLLIFAAHYICDVFRHSPVFRIGGDEFAALLKGRDYENKDALLTFFRENARKMVVDKDKKIYLSIASGMVSSSTPADDFEALLKIADDEMYKNKVRLKGEQM